MLSSLLGPFSFPSCDRSDAGIGHGYDSKDEVRIWK